MTVTSDPITIVTTVIAVIGIISTYITSVRAKNYIAIIQAFLDVVKVALKGDVDGVRSDDDYIAVGKATYKFADEINKNVKIPAFFK